LKEGKACGLAWCSVEGKLSMALQLIPLFDAFVNNNPKQGSQGAIGHLRFWVRRRAKLEIGA